ncbi:hypothetical protein T4D_8447 [Trichinella pseudospiralis]|uniref:Uncharacterized protein n=1 Tax=Trichinella pseudospiralis TaxID=6337 RepID=A0A0V1FHU5_TRIPS|nr:hypothetical protein T4D_8447 [Trichinella pseudospiralis]
MIRQMKLNFPLSLYFNSLKRNANFFIVEQRKILQVGILTRHKESIWVFVSSEDTLSSDFQGVEQLPKRCKKPGNK